MGHQTETHAFDAELVPDSRGRTRRPSPECPVEVALAAVSGRWTTLVLRELMAGPMSFSDLRAALPDLSPKVLADRLRTLDARDLVGRQRIPGFPPRTSYRLTTAGEALRPLLVALYSVGSELLSRGSRPPGPQA
ncbi:HxlR family transcriptional regulator [Herbihabitans rhizosphaerae]|uniref:HxlR family transcriptional regulator n=1 Tax=Herbihabitans rhizosphaerae TaxID=1872711 RepID=A0A4Q7L3T4_9PSEU|nr:helix-turn-helix domain-containing protein [Herbihabitans rhizosphaerae]RZS43816.1 HxlR family transcriptional regulator [Herbihabitans rhizosphaerae]